MTCTWGDGDQLAAVCRVAATLEDGRTASPDTATSTPTILPKPEAAAPVPCELLLAIPAGTVCTALVVLSSARVVELYSGATYVSTVRDGGDGVSSCVEVEVPAGAGAGGGTLRARLLSMRSKAQLLLWDVCVVLEVTSGGDGGGSGAKAGAGLGLGAAAAAAVGAAATTGSASGRGSGGWPYDNGAPADGAVTAVLALEAKWARDLQALEARVTGALDRMGAQLVGRLEALEARVTALQGGAGAGAGGSVLEDPVRTP